MIVPWSAIIDAIRSGRAEGQPDSFQRAIAAVEALAASISEGPLSAALFGWTSMFDLCIQQTDAEPGSGPYLRVSPLTSGRIEFRYIDTAISARQWHREERPE